MVFSASELERSSLELLDFRFFRRTLTTFVPSSWTTTSRDSLSSEVDEPLAFACATRSISSTEYCPFSSGFGIIVMVGFDVQ